MPIDHEIDGARGLVRVRAEGSVSLPEEKACFADALADPRYRAGFAFLIDNRRRWPPATAAHVREMAWEFARRIADLGPARVALVVDRDVSFGLARMFVSHAEGIGLEADVFRDVAAAESWIAARMEQEP